MENLTHIHVGKDCISITIDFSDWNVWPIAERINEFSGEDNILVVNNCQSFLNAYLNKNAPEIAERLKVIRSAPGAEMCCAYFEGVNEENKQLAEKLVQIIEDLFNNEESIISFLNQNGDDIDWGCCGNVRNYNIGAVSQFWICDYVVYGLYLGNPEKFLISANTDSPTSIRKTGDNSGYIIELKYNNQGINHPIHFQITSTDADKVFVHGGAVGRNSYVDTDMDANSAIQLLLSY